VPSARSLTRVSLAVLGVVSLAAAIAVGVPAVQQEGFPAGLALGVAVLLFAAGGASLGGAALLSGRALGRGQRLAVKLAGVLAVAAFALPAFSVFVAPGFLPRLFGTQPLVASLVAWLYLTAAAVAVGVATVAWWLLERAYRRLAARP